MASLYFFKPIGRPLYLFNLVAIYVFLMLTGDQIYYGLTIAINDFTVFLDFFILYLHKKFDKGRKNKSASKVYPPYLKEG